MNRITEEEIRGNTASAEPCNCDDCVKLLEEMRGTEVELGSVESGQKGRSKIWACYSVYNNADYLRASLETVAPHVDHVIVVDGKYKNYPGHLTYSHDGTKETVFDMMDNFDNIRFIEAMPEELETQVSKRNVYMDMVPVGDWVFVIDGDELMFGDNGKLKEEVRRLESHGFNNDRGIISFRQENPSGQVRIRAKMFRKVEGLRYRKYHFNINTPEDHRSWKSIHALDAPIIQSTRFIHLGTDVRSKRVSENKQTFYEMRQAQETPEWFFDQQIEYMRMLVKEHDSRVEPTTENTGDNNREITVEN